MSDLAAPLRARLAAMALLAGTLALTLSRAMRWPNDFSEAHWLLDYRFGFVKRGLVGEVLTTTLGLVGAAPTAAIISGLSVALLTLLCGLLLWMAWQLIRMAPQPGVAILVALAFMSSPFIVMSAHLIGYLDGIFLVLSIVAVALMLRGRPWAAASVQAVALLVHESAVLVGFPVLILAWWVMPGQGDGLHARVKRVAPLLLPLVVFAALAISVRSLPADFQDQYSQLLAQYEFVEGDMHLLVPEWLTPSFAENLAAQKHRFGERVSSHGMFGLIMPTLLTLLVWTVDVCRVRTRSITMALLLGAVLAPQLMHLAAWDTVRIWTYSLVMAWLAAWTLLRTAGPLTTLESRGQSQSGIRGLAFMALLANVLVSTPLLDGLADRYLLSTRLLLYCPFLLAALALFLAPQPGALPANDAPVFHDQ